MLVVMSARRVRETLLDTLARHHVFAELSPHRLIPLLEGAQYHAFEPGTVVFEQFHPAGMFYLLCGGAVTQARFGSERTKPVQRTALD
jgi:signal-transduction protein with cAMP-binding, CBS, and nucleotidyltransferase domain